MSPRLLCISALTLASTLSLTSACGSGDATDQPEGGASGGKGSVGSGSTGSGASGSSGSGVGGGLNVGSQAGAAGSGAEGGNGGGDVCESTSGEAEANPVILTFAFDVSGSMGALDRPNWWHDPEAKWKPVVDATRGFFESEESNGIFASLGFFPAREDKCEPDTYAQPDVALTPLPSTDFGDAFSAYEGEVGSPLAGGNWRGGTPTLAALLGTAEYLTSVRDQVRGAEVATVLVTDGFPQGCDDASMASLVEAVADLRADGVPTYVIGIENPTVPPSELPSGWSDWGSCDSGGGATPCSPPDTLADLTAIADAGGTEQAVLIDTGDPVATREDFLRAIDAIRYRSISCEFEIPPHPDGKTFEPNKIDVKVTLEGQETRLDYDPDCDLENAWHFDDEDSPTFVELCDDSCDALKTEMDNSLTVEFLCEPREDIVK